MKRIILTILILMSFPLITVAEEKGYLFVTSDPIGAEIRINNEPVVQTTPALFYLEAGKKYQISLFKDQHRDAEKSTHVIQEEPTILDMDLIPEFLTTELPGKDGEMHYYILPEGDYAIDAENPEFPLKPVYPKANVIRYLNLSLIPAFTLAFVSNFSADNPNDFNEDIHPIGSVMLGTALTLFITDLIFHFDRKNYEDEFYSGIKEVNSTAVDLSIELFQLGDKHLQEGKFVDAEQDYLNLLMKIPDSSLYPLAFYKLARVHQILGKQELAELEYNILLERYPHPDIYDRTLKGLADLALAAEDREKAMFYFDKMLYVDPLFDKAEIDMIKELLSQ